MRITQAQLRKIIKEEAARMKGKRMNEGLGMGAGLTTSQIALNAMCDAWKEFDPGDPLMDSDAARIDWYAQCDAACKELENSPEWGALVSLLNVIESNLHNGDYGY